MSEKATLENTAPSTSLLTSETPLLSRQRRHELISKKRVASIDLRIGLNLLGENGRMLLTEYIKTKSQ